MEAPVARVGGWVMRLLGGTIALTLAGWLVLAWFFNDQPVPTPAPGDRFVNADGIRMRYRAVGAGAPTIIMLHGFGGRVESWRSVPDAITGAAGWCLRPARDSGRRAVPTFRTTSTANGAVWWRRWTASASRARCSPGRRWVAPWPRWWLRDRPTALRGWRCSRPSGLPNRLELPGLAGRIQSTPVVRTLARWLTCVPGYGVVFPLNLARQSLTLTASYDDAFVAALDSIHVPTVLHVVAGRRARADAASRTYLQRIPGARLRDGAGLRWGTICSRDSDAAARMICDVVSRVREPTP